MDQFGEMSKTKQVVHAETRGVRSVWKTDESRTHQYTGETQRLCAEGEEQGCKIFL